MRVDMLATHPHYRDHILPVFNALPDEVRGVDRHHAPRPGEAADITLVAGPVDMKAMTKHPVVWIEHGVGQSYVDVMGSFSHPGAKHPAHVIGYVSPSQAVADAWSTASGRPAVAVGCPKLDRLLSATRSPERPERRTLAISWRWDSPLGNVCPEALSARKHYDLAKLVDTWRSQGWTVLGHGHPRAQRELSVYWRNLGIRPTWDSFEVLERAALVISDGVSFMYEAAALGRSVLALNAPWYRRDVEHGLRFWTHVPGWQIDVPFELATLDIARYTDEDLGYSERDSAVFHAYAYTDGRSSERAAEFILSLLADDPAGRSRGARSTRPVQASSWPSRAGSDGPSG